MPNLSLMIYCFSNYGAVKSQQMAIAPKSTIFHFSLRCSHIKPQWLDTKITKAFCSLTYRMVRCSQMYAHLIKTWVIFQNWIEKSISLTSKWSLRMSSYFIGGYFRIWPSTRVFSTSLLWPWPSMLPLPSCSQVRTQLSFPVSWAGPGGC